MSKNLRSRLWLGDSHQGAVDATHDTIAAPPHEFLLCGHPLFRCCGELHPAVFRPNGHYRSRHDANATTHRGLRHTHAFVATDEILIAAVGKKPQSAQCLRLRRQRTCPLRFEEVPQLATHGAHCALEEAKFASKLLVAQGECIARHMLSPWTSQLSSRRLLRS